MMKPDSFTIIELLVVIAIIAIIAVIVFPNYKSGQSQFALERATHKLAQDIRRAQQMAMSAEECEKCTSIPQRKVPAGYGIVLDKNWNENKYRLYADTSGDKGFFTPADDVVEEIDLEKGVFIKELYIEPNNRPKVSINFSPSDPETKIKHIQSSDEREVIITLALESDELTIKKVRVNEVGLISVSD